MHAHAVAAALAMLAAGCASTPRPAPAEPAPAGTGDTTEASSTPPTPPGNATAPSTAGWRHFVEPDALAFVWGSAAVAATAYFAGDPPTAPRIFSPEEGGAAAGPESIPNWQVAAGAAAAPLAIALTDSDSRWYHTKGIAQSLLTTAALTELAKNTFGRRRPNYDPNSTDEDARKSFFSGHSSLTLATTTYAGLYLHHHVFSRWRGDAAFAWWELPPYLALGAVSVWVPYTRIADNMHHPSDVMTGAAVGITLSAVFFTWQQSRYRSNHRLPDIALVPLLDTPGAAFAGSF